VNDFPKSRDLKPNIIFQRIFSEMAKIRHKKITEYLVSQKEIHLIYKKYCIKKGIEHDR
jgi:predicted RNase H-like nuclease